MDVPITGTFVQASNLVTVTPNGRILDFDTAAKTPCSTAVLDEANSIPASSSSPQVSVILTVRLLMQGKEVGSIIGKRGDHIKQIRDKSGAKINISDGSCPERIVSITGNLSTINTAFQMISQKFEEDMQALPNSVPRPPITMRLIIPATQCGSIIGKGGTKIKEIREKTGASIQVASEMLPNSTERAVTISGACEALVECMRQICIILQEAPPKGSTLPFRPKPTYNPMLIANSAGLAAAAAQQNQQLLNNIIQQHQSLQNQQQQTTNALMQNMLQYSQPTSMYAVVQPTINNKVAGVYPSYQTGATAADLQNALLSNFALSAGGFSLPPTYSEELQSALIGVDPRFNVAAAAMANWSNGTEATTPDYLNSTLSQIPTIGSQSTTTSHRSSKTNENGQLNQTTAAHIKSNGTGRQTAATVANSSSRRFAPY
ncbi:Poly(RC)-binding protein 3 [Aphelenchoides besseyi]|nr:Poly(RC)-binding protein 3 [Aphelenchoides besseyi]